MRETTYRVDVKDRLFGLARQLSEEEGEGGQVLTYELLLVAEEGNSIV